jgi:hypothetical protein
LANNATVDNRAAGGDFCGAYTNGAFGNALVTTRVNPDVLHGWGVRPYDWQFGVSVQQQIIPRVAVDIGFNRRQWGNFFVTDNLAIGPTDFNTVQITAPSNANLPGGGGYPVSFLVRNGRSSLGATDNYYTSASDYGDWTAYWQGIDITLNGRMANGVTFSGGTSSGYGVRDNCQVTAKVPELLYGGFPGVSQQVSSCSYKEPWLTSARGIVSYTLPKIEVLVSASMRSTPNVVPDSGGTLVGTNGASLAGNVTLGGASIPGGLAPGVVLQNVNLVTQGQVYGERINSLDLRFAKILRYGRTRSNIGIDLYNLFNSNTGTAFNQTFDLATSGAGATPAGLFLRPTSVLNPRFVRFNVTVDF